MAEQGSWGGALVMNMPHVSETFSKQRYLPYELGEVKFYEPSDSGYEQQIRKHLDWLHEE